MIETTARTVGSEALANILDRRKALSKRKKVSRRGAEAAEFEAPPRENFLIENSVFG
jgi:hypothetical protein